ncbi:GNAT family N-acetyltransferase [Sphingomonas sp. RB3P16]|uniref:GNAT family N-acetyltransferase n=1 Tax=Parasphingomonas frigoris TaxID=3096163 RepID=UPI002FCACD3A
MIRRSLLSDLTEINAFDIFGGNRLLEIADDHMLVAEIDGKVVGYVSWVPCGFVGHDYITHLGVDPAHQRRGLGSALLLAAENATGTGRLFASTDENNVAMLALLPIERWSSAGSVACVNKGDRAELFFYKDR